MKKVVFTLGAVSVVCACGLVIDPDKLVEGNASSIGGGPTDGPVGNGEGGGNGDGGGGTDAAKDVATDAPIVEVPECVPSLPNGAQGPYAVVSADATDPTPACPSGYLPTPVATGKSFLVSTPAECNNSAGCTCGTGTGTPKCGLRVRYYDDSNCTGPEANQSTSFSSCNDLETEKYLKVEYNVSGVSCGAGGGSATPTAKSTPAFRYQYVICAPDPAVQTAACKGGDIPLPQAKNADACVIVPTNQSCFGSDYDGSVNISKAGTFTDNRVCNCQCSGAQSNCTGGAATTHTFLFCGGTSANLSVATCTARGANMEYVQQSTAPTVVGGPATCSPRATAGGEVTPNYDLKLCCLNSSGGN